MENASQVNIYLGICVFIYVYDFLGFCFDRRIVWEVGHLQANEVKSVKTNKWRNVYKIFLLKPTCVNISEL